MSSECPILKNRLNFSAASATRPSDGEALQFIGDDDVLISRQAWGSMRLSVDCRFGACH
jgi:hypothetical protein